MTSLTEYRFFPVAFHKAASWPSFLAVSFSSPSLPSRPPRGVGEAVYLAFSCRVLSFQSWINNLSPLWSEGMWMAERYGRERIHQKMACKLKEFGGYFRSLHVWDEGVDWVGKEDTVVWVRSVSSMNEPWPSSNVRNVPFRRQTCPDRDLSPHHSYSVKEEMSTESCVYWKLPLLKEKGDQVFYLQFIPSGCGWIDGKLVLWMKGSFFTFYDSELNPFQLGFLDFLFLEASYLIFPFGCENLFITSIR